MTSEGTCHKCGQPLGISGTCYACAVTNTPPPPVPTTESAAGDPQGLVAELRRVLETVASFSAYSRSKVQTAIELAAPYERRLRAAEQRVRELEAFIRDMEWSQGDWECSSCGHHVSHGHAPECRLLALLSPPSPASQPPPNAGADADDAGQEETP